MRAALPSRVDIILMITVRREERLVTLLVDCGWRESCVANYQNDSVYERQQSPLVRKSSQAFSSSDGENYAYTSSEYNESPNFVHFPTFFVPFT